MSALLAALRRLEGRDASSTAPVAPAPHFAFEPQSSLPLVEPVRSMGWDEVTWPAEPQRSEPQVAPAAVAAKSNDTVDNDAVSNDPTAALVRLLPAPALAAVVAVGVTGELLPLLRGFGEALSVRTGADVVLLGPGTLDDAAGLASQWDALRTQVGYGLVHAPAERATLRLDALRQTAGVIAVVELGRTSVQAVKTIRTLLADGGIPLLGTLVIRDEA
jgi:hypothetical protein